MANEHPLCPQMEIGQYLCGRLSSRISYATLSNVLRKYASSSACVLAGISDSISCSARGINVKFSILFGRSSSMSILLGPGSNGQYRELGLPISARASPFCSLLHQLGLSAQAVCTSLLCKGNQPKTQLSVLYCTTSLSIQVGSIRPDNFQLISRHLPQPSIPSLPEKEEPPLEC